MAKDILTMNQLIAQEQRRAETLRMLETTGAPEASIREARSKLQLTQRRIERARNADYDEEIMEIRRIGSES